MPRSLATQSDQRTLARVVVVLALVLELQDPRISGGLRFNVALFMGLAYLLIVARLRVFGRQVGVLGSWPMLMLAGYVLWCFVTATWASNHAGALEDSFVLLVGLIVAVSIAEVPLATFAKECVRVAVVVAAVSWVMVPVVPQVAALPDVVWRLNGPMGHPQRLALLMGVGIPLLIAFRWSGNTVFKTRGRDLSALLLLTATLLATQTRANTAFVVVVIGVMCYARARPWQKPVFIAAGAAAVWVVVANFASLMAQVDREGSNTATLTGRTTIWEGSIALIREQPWLGYGFDAFHSELTQHFFRNYLAPHAHNMWINAAFETGLIGAALLTLFLLGALAVRPAGDDRHLLWPLVLFCFLCGLTGVVLGGKLSTLWVLVAAMTAQSIYGRNAARDEDDQRLSSMRATRQRAERSI